MKLCLTTSSGLWGQLHVGPEPRESAIGDGLRTSYPDDSPEGPLGPHFQDERLRVSADALVADFEKRMRCVETDDSPIAPTETQALTLLLAQEIAAFLCRVSVEKSWHCSWQLAQDRADSILLRHYV